MRGTLRESTGPSASTVIGLAHVAYGAIGVFTLMITFTFGSGAPPEMAWLVIVIIAIASAARVFGGLWLADGRKRGGVLVCAVDALQCASIAFGGDLLSLDFVIVLVLGVAALWVLPQLELPTPATGD